MTQILISFTLGFLAAMMISSLAAWWAMQMEWRERRSIQRDVKKLMRHFACGQGYVGCNGGPRCNSDHK